jgi:hypothetical protein
MNYLDGSQIRTGDRVRLRTGDVGTVVFSIDTDEYSEHFPKDDWVYLREGIMVKTDKGSLVHLKAPNNEDLLRL